MRIFKSNQIKQRFAIWRAVVFLFIAVALFDCKGDNFLGLEVQPETDFDAVKVIDTFQINAISELGIHQRSDEVQSFLGKMYSEAFGMTSSSLVFNLRMAATVYEDPALTDYQVDSVLLYLRPYFIYGNYSEELPIEVYRLNERVYSDSAYFSNYMPKIDDQVLGEGLIKYKKSKFEASDTILIDGIKQSFVYRIKLNNDLGSHLVAGLGKDYIDTETLQEYFNGLYIKVRDDFQPSSYGAIHQLALTSGESGIRVYISKNGQERKSLTLGISVTNARINSYKHDYTGSILGSYLESDEKKEDNIFVQGMTGTYGKLAIPGLYQFGRDNHVAINKAVLELRISHEILGYYAPASKMYLLTYDKTGFERFTLDYVSNTIRAGGALNSTDFVYTFDITNHIQRILDYAWEGQDINYGIAIHSQVPAVNGNEYSQTILSGDSISFKIYYTDLKD